MAPIPLNTPPALNHLVIFNPTLKPRLSNEEKYPEIERDRDLEDDLAQAAQILFYTSHAESDVSRDAMLLQVGLVKGLMSFTDMVAPGDNPGFWSVHSHRARMVVYSPEPDFYIYVNIALAKMLPDPTRSKVEPIPSAQGIPDGMIVEALKRGYADFRLIHGPISTLMPSPNLSTMLDKFWTRFALHLERTVLAPHPDQSSLALWLGGYPASTSESAAEGVIGVFREDAELGDVAISVVGQSGPISRPPADPAVTRYLVDLVLASLPPLPIITDHVSDLTDDSRKASWTGWVPAIPGMGSRAGTPVPNADEKRRGPKASRWSGLGLGGLGESLGSVGQAFSLGGSRVASGAPPKESEAVPEAESAIPTVVAPTAAEESDGTGVPPIPSSAPEHDVQQSSVSLGELAAAQTDPDIELEWEQRQIWVHDGDEYVERSLSWIIRDSILLYIVDFPATPPTDHILSLFSKLSAISHDDEHHDRPAAANSAIYTNDVPTSSTGPAMDPSSAVSAKELKNVLANVPEISEVYARTAASRFVIGKRSAEEELYLLVGKKDASLVDADHAVRAHERSISSA